MATQYLTLSITSILSHLKSFWMTFKTIQTSQEVDIYLPYQHWLCACKQNELISIFPISIGCVFANNLGYYE